MPVNYGTDLEALYGLKLPIPYIEKASVGDSEIDITLAFSLVMEQTQDYEDIVEQLSDLKFYVDQIFDGFGFDNSREKYTATEISGGTTRATDLIENNYGVMSYYADAMYSVSGSVVADDYFVSSYPDTGDSDYAVGSSGTKVLTFDDFTLGSVVQEVNVANQKVVKFIANTTIASQYASNFSIPDGTGETYKFAENLDLNLCLIAFSSTIDLTDGGTVDVKDSQIIYNCWQQDPIRNFYNSLFSQVSYRKVFDDGQIMRTPTAVFTFEDGIIYNGKVIQTIDGSFHTSEKLTRNALNRSLAALGNSTTLDVDISDSPGLSQAISGFNYLLSTYGDTEELLPRLNIFKKTFIDKSTATATGQWFHKFNKAFMRLNSKVFTAQTLRRELVLTPVVVDTRTRELSNYALGVEYAEEYTAEDSSDFVRFPLMTRLADLDSDVTDETGSEYVLIENGFAYFDYEKALRTHSTISKVFSIDKIDALFTPNALNQYFCLNEAYIDRYDNSDTLFYRLMSSFTDLYLEDATYPELAQTVVTGESGGRAARSDSTKYLFEYTPDDGTGTYYPELLLRNIVSPFTAVDNDYRMMVFQYQSIFNSDGTMGNSIRDHDTIRTNILIHDHTKLFYENLTDALQEFVNDSFQEYVDAAEEFCSYNNDGNFNEFFVTAMEAQYSSAPQRAPWIVAPIHYNIHLDLLYDLYNGDKNEITNQAILLSEQISPSAGNIENLRNFAEKLNEILVHYQNIEDDGGGVPWSTYSDTEERLFSSPLIEVSSFGEPDFMVDDFAIEWSTEASYSTSALGQYTIDYGRHFGSSDRTEVQTAIAVLAADYDDDYEPIDYQDDMLDTINDWINDHEYENQDSSGVFAIAHGGLVGSSSTPFDGDIDGWSVLKVDDLKIISVDVYSTGRDGDIQDRYVTIKMWNVTETITDVAG